MASENNPPDYIPNRLPDMKTPEVIARAQRILDKRGRPPYSADACRTEDEAAVLSEFVYYWLPFLVEKEKLKP